MTTPLLSMYTVLGIYDDSGQNFAETVTAKDQYAAMQQVAQAAEWPHSLCIIGAIEGEHKLLDPACDNHTCAYACDLLSEEEA